MCGRTVGRLRVVAERETTNLCVPSSTSSFSASSSTSSSSTGSLSVSLSHSLTHSLSLSPLFLFAAAVCLPAVSLSLCVFLPTTPFTFLPPSLSPSCTLRLPSPAVHPLLSPFPFPSSVRRSFTRSLTRTPVRSLRRTTPPICELHSLVLFAAPLCPPLSPSVCLASSFPSFIPSRRTASLPHHPILFYVPLVPR